MGLRVEWNGECKIIPTFQLCSREESSCLKCLCHLLSLRTEDRERENINAYLVPQRETSIIPDGSVAATIRSFPGFGLSVVLYHGSAKYLSNLALVSGTLYLGAEGSPNASPFLAAEKYCHRLIFNHLSLLSSTRGMQIDRSSFISLEDPPTPSTSSLELP